MGDQRRRKGEGTVYQRADGRWAGRLKISDGTVKYFYGRNRPEVEGALALARTEREDRVMVLRLGERRYEKLKAEAERLGISPEQVLLRTVDELQPPPDVRRRAADAILAMPPMPVPDDPEDLRREIEAMYDAAMPDDVLPD